MNMSSVARLGRCKVKRGIFALVAMLLIAPRNSASGQDQKTKAELQRTAIQRVLAGERIDRLVVVATDSIDAPVADEVARKLGAARSSKVCNRSKPCNWAPEKGKLAISAEVTSLDDSTATVTVVTWGKGNPSKGGEASTSPPDKHFTSVSGLVSG